MNPELLKYLKSLGVKPDALAGIGKKRPTATEQAKGMVTGPAGAAFDMLVREPTYRAAKAIWEQKPGALAAETLVSATPVMGIPGRASGKVARELMRNMTKGRFAILTAENAGGRALSAAENEARNAALLKALSDRGYKPVPVKGRYSDPTTGEVLAENSFLVPNLPEREAKLLGKRFGQNGVITQRGYHDMVEDKLFPSSGVKKAKDVPYTELPGGKRVALDIDWNSPLAPNVAALPVPKNASPEAMRIIDDLRAQMPEPPKPMRRVKEVPEAAGREMAKVYENLPVNDPAAREAYLALNDEVSKQMKAIKDAGYKIEFTDSDPYKSSSELFKDIRDNRTLKVLKTNEASQHPFMSREQNDAFRAVHDFVAHAGGGNQFGKVGEENAYRIHASTLSPLARRALATETRGQNSWVNFGPNANLPPAERPFAPQKAALFPEELTGEYPGGSKAATDSVAMQAVKGLPMLKTGGKNSPLEWNELTADRSPFAVPGDRHFIFKTPEGYEAEVIGQRVGEDFRVSWAGVKGRGQTLADKGILIRGAGDVGAGNMRQIGRQLRDITGSKTISGERISGARPDGGGDLGGREARRVLSDSAYTRVLDAAFNEGATGVTATRRKNLAEARKSAAIISGDPVKTWEAELGGKPLFDYRSLGRDVEPVVQQNVERNLPTNAQGFATYSRAAQQAADAMRSSENMARLDLGLRAGGEKWYFLDPIERAFKDEYGEEQGRKHFVDFTKTLGAGSPASDWGKNLERSLWAWPQIRARMNMLEQPLPPGMGSLTQQIFQRGFQNVVEDKPITKTPYKVLSFAENLAGNFAPFTADRHMLRHYGLPEAGSGVGYAGVEDAAQEFAQEQAARFGMPPGRAPTAAVQSAPWIGDAIGGRVQSQPFPALLDIEQAIRRMAQSTGMSPSEVFRKYIIQGSPLK